MKLILILIKNYSQYFLYTPRNRGSLKSVFNAKVLRVLYSVKKVINKKFNITGTQWDRISVNWIRSDIHYNTTPI